MFMRKWAIKAWEAISHADTALSALSLFPWKSGLAIMASLTPAALSIGSVPAWAIAFFVLIGMCVVAACLLLTMKIIDWLGRSGAKMPTTHIGKKQKHTDDSEAQQLREALRQAKKTHAEAVLRWFATRVSMNIDMARVQNRTSKDIRVTVRFAEYKDLNLAKEIEAIIKNCTRWPVEVDGSNNPTIMPDKDCKVVFDVGPGPGFREVVWAFTYGELVKCKIGWKETERFEETEHLIINVLPTITQ